MQAIIPTHHHPHLRPLDLDIPYPYPHPSSTSISRLRRPFFHHHIPSYNIHRFRPSSTAGKRKEYHFFQSFGYLIITGLHWRFIIIYLHHFFPSPWTSFTGCIGSAGLNFQYFLPTNNILVGGGASPEGVQIQSGFHMVSATDFAVGCFLYPMGKYGWCRFLLFCLLFYGIYCRTISFGYNLLFLRWKG
ncbi:hypothetical protein HDV62DRAFT_237619 [Trichoderma sp. SZMC 28011]